MGRKSKYHRCYVYELCKAGVCVTKLSSVQLRVSAVVGADIFCVMCVRGPRVGYVLQRDYPDSVSLDMRAWET